MPRRYPQCIIQVTECIKEENGVRKTYARLKSYVSGSAPQTIRRRLLVGLCGVCNGNLSPAVAFPEICSIVTVLVFHPSVFHRRTKPSDKSQRHCVFVASPPRMSMPRCWATGDNCVCKAEKNIFRPPRYIHEGLTSLISIFRSSSLPPLRSSYTPISVSNLLAKSNKFWPKATKKQ
jgi:hypothetical protein